MKSGSQSKSTEKLKRCSPKRLASTPVVTVDGCGCGSMQLHMGPMTLRLNANAAAALVATLSRALAGLPTVPCPRGPNEHQDVPITHYGDA
ncbi:MAG: hypothetical protein AAGF92_18425 [Myxococcota bacterium]